MRTRPNNGEVAIAWRLGRIVLVMGGIAAALAIAVANGLIGLPGIARADGKTQASYRSALDAQELAADRRWASASCTSILAWKNEIERDGKSIDLGFGPVARIEDAITATNRTISELKRLGLPPGAGAARARADLTQLRSEIDSRLRDIEGTASSVARGNLAAIGTLVGDLENDKVLAPQIAGELSHAVSVDLGMSLIETRACRELVGSPV